MTRRRLRWLLGGVIVPFSGLLVASNWIWRPIGRVDGSHPLALTQIRVEGACDAFALGVGRLLMSVDGGRTWTDRSPADTLFSSYSVSRDRILAVGSARGLSREWQPAVFSSADQGRSWHKVPVPTDSSFEDIAVCESGRVVLLGATSISVSQDGSSFLEALRTTKPESGSVTCGLDSVIWVSRGDQGLLSSADGGLTWRSVERPPAAGVYRIASSGTRLTAISSGGSVFQRSGMETWEPVDGFGPVPIRAVAFRGLSGVAVGDVGALFESSDGGGTWARRSTLTSEDLLTVGWPRDGLPIAAGTAGTVLRRGLPRFCNAARGSIGRPAFP